MKREYSDFVKESLKLRPIAYYPIYTEITGSVLSGLMLSQLMYWFRKKSKVFKTENEMMLELQISRSQFRSSSKKVKSLPFLNVSREGARGKTHYTLNRSLFMDYIVSYIKEHPELAGLYIEQLSEHPDFAAYYAEHFYGWDIKNPSMAKTDPLVVNSDPSVAKTNPSMVKTSQTTAKNDQTGVNNDQSDKESEPEADKSSTVNFDQTGVKTDPLMAKTDPSVAKSDTSLTETTKTTIEDKTTVIGLNDTHIKESSSQEPSDPSLHSSSEDKPQKDESPKNDYSPEFEFAWKLYKVNTSMKGSKVKASKAYAKAMALHKSADVIVMAVEKYLKSSSFELRPAQAASFFNGICDPGHKYYLDYIKGGYEEKLELVKAKEVVRLKENLSAQEIYRKDLGKQGDLNTEELMARTTKINSVLTEKFGVKKGIFRFKDREDWVQYTGPEYLTMQIKHPRSKTDKIRVLFHIKELRDNLYVHLHGHIWDDKLEQRYNDVNVGIEDLPSLEAPRKEDL